MAQTSPAGDTIQLAAGFVGDTVAQHERPIHARFGERGLTKAARDLGLSRQALYRRMEKLGLKTPVDPGRTSATSG